MLAQESSLECSPNRSAWNSAAVGHLLSCFPMAQRRYPAYVLWRIIMVSTAISLIVVPLLLFSWSRPVEIWAILSNISCPGLENAHLLSTFRDAYCHKFLETPDLIIFPIMLALFGAVALFVSQFFFWATTIMTAHEQALFIVSMIVGVCEYVVWIIYWSAHIQDLVLAFCEVKPPSMNSWFMLLVFCVLLVANALVLLFIYLQLGEDVKTKVVSFPKRLPVDIERGGARNLRKQKDNSLSDWHEYNSLEEI
jgi:hypothetical protein